MDPLSSLRERLEALHRGEVQGASLLDRALARIAPRSGAPVLEKLSALDRELDAVGIHTSMDARLLVALGVQEGRAGALAKGLGARADEVLAELAAAVGLLERQHLAGQLPAGQVSALKERLAAAARVVRVAELFAGSDDGGLQLLPRPGSPRLPAPAAPRVAIAELWAARAGANAEDVLGRRRDLDAAYELLLVIGDELDRDRVRHLRASVAQAREAARGSPPTRSLRELTRQLRSGRTSPREAYAALRGLYERAVEARDEALAGAAASALAPFLTAPALKPAVENAEALRRSAWLGEGGARDELSNRLLDLAIGLDPAAHEFFELAAGVERYFDVEDALGQEVLEEKGRPERPVLRRVPYPTQTLTFEHTGGLHELHNFVLSDPRRLVYDLASNRQPVRAYLEEVPAPRPQKVVKTAVRVYVCDASGSMFGRRCRMRNALLLAELNNLRRKALRGEPFDPLYFCFFNDRATQLTRVDSAQKAGQQMTSLLAAGPAEGQTDISLALISAFESIRAAQGKDPHLSRATVVLITDGEDRIDLAQVRKARAPVGAVEVSLSFISLGEENRDLRELAQEQRSKGGRAFYHHLSDREIASARSEFDSGWRTLLPRQLDLTPELLRTLRPNLDALEALARREPVKPTVTQASFDAMFPAPGQPAPGAPAEAQRCADIVAAIAEAAPLAPLEGRAAESVTLLTHLLTLYAIAMPAYLKAAHAPSAPLAQALERVRLLCRP